MRECASTPGARYLCATIATEKSDALDVSTSLTRMEEALTNDMQSVEVYLADCFVNLRELHYCRN